MLWKRISRLWENTSKATDKTNKSPLARLYLLQGVLVFIFAVLLYRLWELQIVNGPKYVEEFELKTTRTVKDGSLRGNIYDCNGEILAYNKLVYTVTMMDNGDYSSGRERQLGLNGMIYKVIKKLEENGERLNNELKIITVPDGGYEYTVTGMALERFKADIFGAADPADLSGEQSGMSADEMIRFLAGNDRFALYGEGKKMYSAEELWEHGLPEEYTQEEILAIVGIRYMLSLNAYRRYVPVTLAGDVSEETVAFIKENNECLSGVDIGQEWERVYDGGEAFSHILGYVGKIPAEELEAYEGSAKGYTVDSVVGKTGIEQYLEEELQGVDGERHIIVNNVGKIVGEESIVRQAVSGRDVYLSIDKNLQIAVYHILEQKLADILSVNLINAKEFDKSNLADTTEIRIPIYDVYIALFENQVIRTEDFYCSDATELEQSIAEAWEKEQEEVLESLKKELLEGDTGYCDLSAPMRAYESYIVDECGLLEDSLIDQKDAVYGRWKNGGDISIKEFLLYVIERGWLRTEVLDSSKRYFTAEEMYDLLVESIEKKLKNSSTLKKMLFRYMILEDKISGTEICMLLYDQGILPAADEDYEMLMAGKTDSFSFMKKKIEQLEITPARLALDPCSASAVVVQEGTGQVLACVSYPGYDQNRLANQMDAEYYDQLLADKSLPLYNRATQQLTAPGSTLKPITIIAGLQEGVISPDTSIFCDGTFDKVEPPLRCWKHSGHGNVVNASTAIQFSCNDYLCEISYRLGLKNGTVYDDALALSSLREYAALFHLDEKSGIELDESMPHITDAYGIPSAIGQGTHNYTTVQLARYVSSIASEGDVFSLSLIKGVADADGVLKEEGIASKAENIVPESRIELPEIVWHTVKTGMLQYAQNNSALKDMEVSVAGKTGTAQESKRRPDHALFVGYAPAEKPEITVVVRIANVYASGNAAAAGRSIFNTYFGIKEEDAR